MQVAAVEQDLRPPTMRPGRPMSRRIDSAVMLLPQPDSPTTPSVSPSSIEKLTPSTALTTPSWVKKWVAQALDLEQAAASASAAARARPSRTAVVTSTRPLAGIEGVAQAVAEEAGGEDDEDDGDDG